MNNDIVIHVLYVYMCVCSACLFVSMHVMYACMYASTYACVCVCEQN